MARVLYANSCTSTLSKAISSTDTSMSVDINESSWPEITSTSSDYFFVTLINPNNGETEIVKVTRCNPVTGLMNIIRAQDGTTAKNFPLKTKVEMRIVKAFFDAYVGAAAFVPFFAYRLEHPSALPQGWIHCNGSAYEKSTQAGRALASLPEYTKQQWGLVETTTSITAPNFYTELNGEPYEVISGYNAGKKDTVVTTIQANKEDPVEDITVITKHTVQMTPALFVGV